MNDVGTMRGDSNHLPGETNGMPVTMGSYDSNTHGEFQDVMSGAEESPSPMLVTPDMLYKLSKKIAQLTKVIYSLNTKNDDLETDLEHLRVSYEDKLKLCQQQLQLATANLQQQLQQDNLSESADFLRSNNGVSSPENGTRRRRSKTPEIDYETKKELKRTRQCLKQTEAKVKAMEEEILEKKQEMDRLHKEAAARQFTPAPISNGENSKLEQKVALLEQQLKQSNREKLDAKLRLDRLDIQKENLRLERDMLKKDLNETNSEKSGLQLQLSAARIQLNYNREMGYTGNNGVDKVDSSKSTPVTPENDDFADELIAKIEVLTQERGDLAKELEESRSIQQKQLKELEQLSKASKVAVPDPSPSPDVHKRCEFEKTQLGYQISQLESSLKEMSESHEEQLAAIRGDKDRALEISSTEHELELQQIRSSFDREKAEKEIELASKAAELSELIEKTSEKEFAFGEKDRRLATVQQQLAESTENLRARLCELEEARALLSNVQESESQLRQELSEIRQSELMFKQEMGQNVEKLCTLEEKCKTVEKERDDLKRKCKEIEAKMDVMTRTVVKDTDEKVRQLERALEEALVEREEILEACEKEIQHERTIAIETEQKMMDDFEWKLREIESEYRNKIREAEETSRDELNEYSRKKDEELTRMSISARREFEEKLRLERNSLKTALDSQHGVDREKALEVVRAESRMELRILQSSWDEEKNRLDREVRSLNRRIEELEKEALARKAEVDRRIVEEQRKGEMSVQRVRQEIELIKQECEGKLESLKAEHASKIEEYESRLEAANDNRMSSMFEMRDEVEIEFTERMEQLRTMYMTEIESQAEKMQEDKAKANRTEVSLRQMLAERQAEVDELNTYYTQAGEEYETKINELLTRLQDQTALAVKLQSEIDEYEWYEEEEVGGGGAAATGAAVEEEEEEKRTQTPRRPASRPSSTRPLEQHRIPEPEMNPRYATSSVASLASTASYNTATGQIDAGPVTAATPDSLQSFASNSSSPSQPEPPPRANSAANRRSWNPEVDSPQPQQHTVTQNPDPTPQADPLFKLPVADRATGDGSSTSCTPGLEHNGEPVGTGNLETHPPPESQIVKKMDLDFENQSTGVVDSRGKRKLTFWDPLIVNSSKLDSNLKLEIQSMEKDPKMDLPSSAIFDEEILTPFGRSTESLPESDTTESYTSEAEDYIATCKLETRTKLIEPAPENKKVETLKDATSLGAINKSFKNDNSIPTFKTEEEKLIFGILKDKICDKKESKRTSTEEESLEREQEKPNTSKPENHEPKLEEIKFIDEDEADSKPKPENPSIQVDPENDDVTDQINQLIPLATAKSPSRSSLGAFFHQKLFHSASATSSAPTSTSSGHSSPEIKIHSQTGHDEGRRIQNQEGQKEGRRIELVGLEIISLGGLEEVCRIDNQSGNYVEDISSIDNQAGQEEGCRIDNQELEEEAKCHAGHEDKCRIENQTANYVEELNTDHDPAGQKEGCGTESQAGPEEEESEIEHEQSSIDVNCSGLKNSDPIVLHSMPTRILMILSMMLILHAMMLNL